MDGQDDKYENRAKRFISRTPGDHDEEQTIALIAELYRVENELNRLEHRINNIDSTLWSCELRDMSKDIKTVSDDIHTIQRAINSPDDSLHEPLNIEEEEIDNAAVSEILTQLGWEWFPRELNRIYSTQSRVFNRFDSKKQRMLTNRIVLLSLLAVVVSVVFRLM
jgi:hypothetical protein